VKHKDEEDEQTRRLRLFLEQIGSEASGDPEKDVFRALMAHPAAIAPIYRAFIDPDPVVGRLPMLGEIALRVRKAHGSKR
jgi:hypothetical protein